VQNRVAINNVYEFIAVRVALLRGFASKLRSEGVAIAECGPVEKDPFRSARVVSWGERTPHRQLGEFGF
jgi:hypothetical protein